MESIKHLQDLYDRLVSNYNDNTPFEQFEEDRLVVLNVLEKQIPKRVELYIGNENYIFKNYPCPCCGEMLGLKVNKRYVKFCPNCGQALDWSDNE